MNEVKEKYRYEAIAFYRKSFDNDFNEFIENHSNYEFVSMIQKTDFSIVVIFRYLKGE